MALIGTIVRNELFVICVCFGGGGAVILLSGNGLRMPKSAKEAMGDAEALVDRRTPGPELDDCRGRSGA